MSLTRDYPVRIFYPATTERMVLRVAPDWERDLLPQGGSADGTRRDFVVTTDEPYFYFKPCLLDQDGGLRWAVGGNYLAITTQGEGRDVYPYFQGGANGDFTRRLAVGERPDGSDAHYVRVYQPPGYHENTLKRYPVLYMHDGTNLFFPEEAFLGRSWNVQGTLDVLDQMNVIDKVLVVGIYAADRMAEYTAPGYAEYGRFVATVLKPLIDQRFRTLSGPADTAIMGSSLGGVVSFHIAWQWPEVFGKAACLSSTFGYRDDLLARVQREERRPVRFYLDSGWPEDNYEPTQSMRDALAHRGAVFGQDLLYFAFPNAMHNEHFWAMRSHIPFQFFFGKTPAPRRV